MQSSSVDNVNAEGLPSDGQLHPSDDTSESTTDAQNEENSRAMTSNNVVMEASPAYQPLEIATACTSKDKSNRV